MLETKKYSHEDLMRLYTEAEEVDKELFSEMRSNLLLVAGEHYNRRRSEFYRRIRESSELNEQQKLRLTKNHIQKIVKTYVNNTVSLAPGVGFQPKNESEIQDQKAAELHHAVWQDLDDYHSIHSELIPEWCDDFFSVGEVATKVFFDPNEGPIVAYYQAVNEQGEPLFEEDGVTPKRGRPKRSGKLMYEEVLGFNLLRAPEAKSMKLSPYLIIRKMVDRKKLISMFPDKEKFLNISRDETMVVFDTSKNSYRKSENEVLIKEFFFRPCEQYPNGYFFIATNDGVLSEGELPGGVFPIVFQGCERIPTSPRGRSPIKQMRPYQAEINRAASKIAEHHITLGDDKVLLANGSDVTQGMALPGVRAIKYTGAAPVIIPGRDGSQFLEYMNAQIAELYAVMGVEEDGSLAKDGNGQFDPMAMLFKAASQKRRFKRYTQRFENFLVELAKISLKLSKIHLSEENIIYAVGKKERINISEFKNADDLSYQIKVEPQSDDVETKMGKQMALNHALQYVGNQLTKEDIGKIMRSMPYGNFNESFSDMTLDYDSATNDILALDRGELPPVHEYDNHTYMVRRLVSRMRQADFKFLPPEIQQNYALKVEAHERAEAAKMEKLMAVKEGLIPTGGYLVTCDFYSADPKDPAKTRRIRLPSDSISWLIKQLEAQGKSLDQLEAINQGAIAQMAEMLLQKRGGNPDGMGSSVTPGAEMPGGVANNVPEPRNFGISQRGLGQPYPGSLN